jgi:hypothetical protein
MPSARLRALYACDAVQEREYESLTPHSIVQDATADRIHNGLMYGTTLEQLATKVRNAGS